MIEINFSYIDEFGQKSVLEKTFTEDVLEVESSADLLFEQFKSFMIAAGFAQELVNKFVFEDNE